MVIYITYDQLYTEVFLNPHAAPALFTTCNRWLLERDESQMRHKTATHWRHTTQPLRPLEVKGRDQAPFSLPLGPYGSSLQRWDITLTRQEIHAVEPSTQPCTMVLAVHSLPRLCLLLRPSTLLLQPAYSPCLWCVTSQLTTAAMIYGRPRHLFLRPNRIAEDIMTATTKPPSWC